MLKITTVVVWVALIALPVSLTAVRYFSNCWDCGSGNCSQLGYVPQGWMIAAISLVPVAIIYFTRALAPRGFALNDIELVIDRPMNPIKIPLTSVTQVRRLEDTETKMALRLMGASGFYGHYGWFWNKRLGKFRLYAGRFNDLVLVRSGTTLFILGPEDTEAFTAHLRAMTRL